jgi:hypothetical protein
VPQQFAALQWRAGFKPRLPIGVPAKPQVQLNTCWQWQQLANSPTARQQPTSLSHKRTVPLVNAKRARCNKGSSYLEVGESARLFAQAAWVLC